MRASIPRRLGVGLLASALALAAALVAMPHRAEASEPWQGFVNADHANIRSAPNSKASIVTILGQGKPVTVAGWVSGEEVDPTNNTWAQLGDGQYVYSAVIEKNKPTSPPPVPGGIQYQGKWIDVNITQQTLTAYEGSKPVHIAVVSAGRPDYPTPMGNFTVLRRVASETMDSGSVPWVRDHYRLDNVRFTQYFTPQGAALHEAYWKAPNSFGIPTSHGCVGMNSTEAQWVWSWADVGTPVYIHQ